MADVEDEVRILMKDIKEEAISKLKTKSTSYGPDNFMEGNSLKNFAFAYTFYAADIKKIGKKYSTKLHERLNKPHCFPELNDYRTVHLTEVTVNLATIAALMETTPKYVKIEARGTYRQVVH